MSRRPATYAERVGRALLDLVVTAVALGLVLAAAITWAATHAPETLPQ